MFQSTMPALTDTSGVTAATVLTLILSVMGTKIVKMLLTSRTVQHAFQEADTALPISSSVEQRYVAKETGKYFKTM